MRNSGQSQTDVDTRRVMMPPELVSPAPRGTLRRSETTGQLARPLLDRSSRSGRNGRLGPPVPSAPNLWELGRRGREQEQEFRLRSQQLFATPDRVRTKRAALLSGQKSNASSSSESDEIDDDHDEDIEKGGMSQLQSDSSLAGMLIRSASNNSVSRLIRSLSMPGHSWQAVQEKKPSKEAAVARSATGSTNTGMMPASNSGVSMTILEKEVLQTEDAMCAPSRLQINCKVGSQTSLHSGTITSSVESRDTLAGAVNKPHKKTKKMSRSESWFMTALVATAALSSCIYGLVLAATNASVNFIHVDFETCGVIPAPVPLPNSTSILATTDLMQKAAAPRQMLGMRLPEDDADERIAEVRFAKTGEHVASSGWLEYASSVLLAQIKGTVLYEPELANGASSASYVADASLDDDGADNLDGDEGSHVLLLEEKLVFNCPHQTFIQQISVAAVLLGAGAGSLLGGPFADRVGRRGSMLRLNFVAFFVFLSCALATGWWTFITARFLAGLCIGAVSVAVPMYIAEVCPDDLRGKFGVAHQLLITIGILLSDALGLVQSQDIDFRHKEIARSQITAVDKYWWRVMVGFSCLPSLMYESPVWLVRAGRKQEAIAVVKTLKPNSSKASVENVVNTMEVLQQASGESKSFGWALSNSYYRVGVIIGCILSACQQTSGINVMITQSTTVFLQVANYKYATLLTTLTGVLNVVVTLATISLIEKLGRRNLLLISAIGTTASMGTCLLCVIFDVGVSIMVPCMIMVFIMFFAVGWGPVVWIYLSDIYPAEIKGSCFAHAIMVNWVACAIVVFGIGNFLHNNLITYSIFTVLNIFGLFFVLRYVVETKGTSVEDSPIYAGRERPAFESTSSQA
ncbi:unnamed protein product [Amoebophrya sp. A25]|nr:unnamed protein product [Amoebophrya sp. A25]|eukprot:GSA25T00000746001.1